jgi:phenylpropionate dioxygenase-like ring-hydroxylating dioxygenase large terminal subunit
MPSLPADFFGALEDSTGPATDARLLPPSCYTSEDVFGLEMDAIWSKEWLAVARESDVPNVGDYLPRTIAGEPLVVVRAKDGALNVLSAVCRHQGMVVADGSPGNCTTFVCPYHLWTYGLDGRLLGAPAMERTTSFVKAEHSLPRLPVEIWNGFVFTTFNPDPRPLAPSLVGAEHVLRNYDLAAAHHLPDESPVLPWNWKIMLENFVDGYHAHRLHKGIYDYGPADQLEFLPWDDSNNHITRINRQTKIDASFNPTLSAVLPPFTKLTDEERSQGVFVLIPPSLALAIQPDQVVYFIIDPHGPTQIQIHIGWLIDPDGPRNPLFPLIFNQIVKPGVMNFVVDDIRVDTAVQIGLKSRFAPRGRYSWQQESQAQLNRWVVRRYRAGTDADHSRSMAVAGELS